MSLNLIQRPDLNLEFLPTQLLSFYIENNTPWRTNCPRQEEIINYLQETNGILIEKTLGMDYIKAHYAISASIYTFFQTEIKINVPDKIKSDFRNIVRRSPYNLNNPFDLFFIDVASGDSDQVEQEEKLNAYLLPMEPDSLHPDKFFNQTSRFIRNLNDRLKIVIGKLISSYQREEHLSFVGLYDVCFPVFKIKKNRNHNDLAEKLRFEYGEYLLPLPTIF